MPLYLRLYSSEAGGAGSARTLCPKATMSLETSLKRRMPLGEEESKVRRCVLFRTNSAKNFRRGVVTCTGPNRQSNSVLFKPSIIKVCKQLQAGSRNLQWRNKRLQALLPEKSYHQIPTRLIPSTPIPPHPLSSLLYKKLAERNGHAPGPVYLGADGGHTSGVSV